MGSIGAPETPNSMTLLKYEDERQKRLRSDGLAQYVDLRHADQQMNSSLAEDPFSAEYGERPYQIPAGLEQTGRSKLVVVGTGYGGITYAIRLLLGAAHFRPEDIVLIDFASGFGGAWYWNRYPGVMCDVESACYMPLLEETGYVPLNKYSYGTELRQYAELLASTYKLTDRALWKTVVKSATWDEARSEWVLEVSKRTRDGEEKPMTIRTEFVVLTAGPLTNPKLPRVTGMESFRGTTFHTARWDYETTGGSPGDTKMTKLEGKRVAIVGTGATCIQAAPQLAKWAKQLYIVQRTPSAVDDRGQHEIDGDQFRTQVNRDKGWQKRRRENMAMFVQNNAPQVDLVRDGWTSFPSFAALIGGPGTAGLTAATLPHHLAQMHRLDLPRQERLRRRVHDVVRDPAVADALTPWYPGWCKRPGFHDDFLQTFNLPNVELVDTNGRGIDSINETGLVCRGKEYPIDVLIWGTGFEPMSAGGPSLRAGIQIYGRHGLEMETKWQTGLATLHGIITRDFPNFFLSGVYQMGTTVNYVHMADVMGTHAANLIREARKKLSQPAVQKLVIEPSLQGEEAWTQQVLKTQPAFGTLTGCTPSYTTGEGKRAKSKEEELVIARAGNWGKGFLDYAATLEDYDRTADLVGLDYRAVAA